MQEGDAGVNAPDPIANGAGALWALPGGKECQHAWN